MTAVHDGQWGFGGPTACVAAVVSYRQLDYWARIGLVVPSLRSDADPRRRLYSVGDMVMLNVFRRLLKGGCSLRSFRPVMLTLRNLPDLAAATIVSDGNTVYLCRTADESANLLRTNQAVFTVHVRDVVAEVNDVLATFPPGQPGHRRGTRDSE
jgi:DNA-binding transcriptional MerR regulator